MQIKRWESGSEYWASIGCYGCYIGGVGLAGRRCRTRASRLPAARPATPSALPLLRGRKCLPVKPVRKPAAVDT